MGSQDISPTIFAFIDAANIIYGASNRGWSMDFEKLIEYLKNRYGVSRALYYAGVDQNNKKQLRFYERLQEFGYLLRLVPVKTFKGGRKKADVDARLAFEAMKYVEEYDQAVFLTGNGDFFWLLEYLRQNDKDITLLAHRRSTARELKQLFGGEFTDLSRLKDKLEFTQ